MDRLRRSVWISSPPTPSRWRADRSTSARSPSVSSVDSRRDSTRTPGGAPRRERRAGRRSRPNCTVSNSSVRESSARRVRARCVACGRLYDAAHRSKLACLARACTSIPRRRRRAPRPIARFDLRRARSTSRRPRHDFRDVYWHVWGALHVLPRCATCRAHASASELGLCLYHPTAPTFDRGNNEGTHGCCGARAPSIRRRRPHAREEDVAREKRVPRPPRGAGVLSPDSEAWEAARWILSATRRHRALVVDRTGSAPRRATRRRRRRRDRPPPPAPHGCVNGVYLARDHHALAFADEDEERRRTLVFDGDFAKSEARARARRGRGHGRKLGRGRVGRRRGMGPSAAHARDVRGRGARIGRERSDARVRGRFACIEHVVVGDVVILRWGVHGRRVRGSRGAEEKTVRIGIPRAD